MLVDPTVCGLIKTKYALAPMLRRLLNHSGRTIVHCNIHLVRASPVVGKGETNSAIAAISPSPSSPPGTSVPGPAR